MKMSIHMTILLFSKVVIMKWEQLKEVSSSKYFGVTVPAGGNIYEEIGAMSGLATAGLARLQLKRLIS